MENITKKFQDHYTNTFNTYGASPKGIDWEKEENCLLSYENFVQLISQEDIQSGRKISMLDVGCGYGGLYKFAKEKNINLDYTGIDIIAGLIDFATNDIPEGKFYCQDIFEFNDDIKYDYVVCNGIMTLRLGSSIMEMDKYCKELIRKMFTMCTNGIAYNFMTTRVNFMVDNLFYKNPIEALAFGFELTTKLKIDHNNPHYYYTVYLYKENIKKMMV